MTCSLKCLGRSPGPRSRKLTGRYLVRKCQSLCQASIYDCEIVDGTIFLPLIQWFLTRTFFMLSGLPSANPKNRRIDQLQRRVRRRSYDFLHLLADSFLPPLNSLLIDYRWFDAKNIAPRFPFGFGLSYTTFSYANLKVTPGPSGGSPPTGPGSSLSPWLVDLCYISKLFFLLTRVYIGCKIHGQRSRSP